MNAAEESSYRCHVCVSSQIRCRREGNPYNVNGPHQRQQQRAEDCSQNRIGSHNVGN